jgi:hypothetical protein
MTATKKLHDLGQSLWLDNVIRDLLTSGTLKRHIEQMNPMNKQTRTTRLAWPNE